MSHNFNNKIRKENSRHTITNIKSNQNILLSQLINFMPPIGALSKHRSKSKNNYSTKNIYFQIDKKEKTTKDKDEIIKKLKERIKALENKIKFLEIKVENLSKLNSNYNTSSKNSKNHSINWKENLNEKEFLNEKKEFKSIIIPKKNQSLKIGYNKKKSSSELLTDENIYDMKERCSTIINTNNNSIYRKYSKNRKKIELNMDKFDKKKQSINYHNINEILKKAIIKKTHLRKNSKFKTNLNDLDLNSSITKLILKLPKTFRLHYQIESNVNSSSRITSSTTFNYYNKQNISNNYSENNNVLTSNNNIYTEEGEIKEEYPFTNNITYLNIVNNNYSNEIVKSKLNQIKKRTAILLETFVGMKICNK